MQTDLLLVVSAFFAGAINSVAGGGTFLTFPALIWSGIPPINANATSTLAVFPGSFSSFYAYRKDFKRIDNMPLGPVIVTSLVGGWIGSAILLATPEQTFAELIPWLLLIATVLFAFGKKLGAMISAKVKLNVVQVMILLFGIALYGGYFGAGIGILTLALLALLGLNDIHKMNAVKTLAAGMMNVAAIVNFIMRGAIYWRPALIMAVAAIIGGYIGARLAKKVDQKFVWWTVLAIGTSLTCYFFYKAYAK